MASNFHLKTAFYLLMLCTMSMIFYAGNLTDLENKADEKFLQLVNYGHLNNSSSQNEKKRPTDLKRKKHLQMMCDMLANKTDGESLTRENFDHILVDEKHKLLYCYVPKVACTNWKRIFMILTGKSNATDLLSIPASTVHGKGVFTKLSNYSTTDIDFILKNFTKFLFVRHPFERLLSAYRNKLEQHYLSSKYFQSRFGRHIVKHYRKSPTKEALLNGDDVTFFEFVTYLTNPKDVIFNEHWKPIHQLCWPCFIDYDIIGKYETLYEDSEYILNHIGKSEIIFPRSSKASNTASILKKYFSLLPKLLIKELYSIYFMDFKLFGYSFEEFIDENCR
ncbi:carbohydrate sulfotransferase 11 [Anabrus simplex]|uniref:carbohydrate sulfotransferase 11 n=1 Tax=Anabrus simplex TaxID=316456 RepID=UPI0035A38F40